MFEGSLRSSGLWYICEYLSLLLSRIGNLSVSTPLTGMKVSLSGGSESRCWAYAWFTVEFRSTTAVSVMAVFRIEVSFRNNEMLLGRDSSDRLKCFLMLV